MKYFDFKRIKFSTIKKYLNLFKDKFLKFFDLKSHNFKYFGFKKYNLIRSAKNFDLKPIIIDSLKRIKFISYKVLFLHFPIAVIFFGFLYLFIPTFYNYEKSDIKGAICKNKKFECLIRGDVNYSFYPTPRINLKDVVIKNTFKNKTTFISADSVSIRLSIQNLLAKEKHKFKEIKLNKFEVNFQIENYKKYKNIFLGENKLIPLNFKDGKVSFFDGDNYVAAIDNVNIMFKSSQELSEANLKGNFLNDKLFVEYSKKKDGQKILTDLELKMSNLNLLTKINLFNNEKNREIINGNILIKKDKNRITAIFDYKDDEIIINKSNLRNAFIDGKSEGKIKILPYFDFELDLNLNSINLTKLESYFLSLDEKQQRNFFKINKKINGKLNLSSDKIYSGYNLAKSFESRIKFNNGNILIEQFLLNLGKLGAADLLGVIDNQKKYTSLKFESNVFVDNQKKFLSKFGIYNKDSIPSNIFISGHLDLENLRMSFYEISDEEKLNNEDLNFIEKEFNDIMFEDRYKSLFAFPDFKEFIKSISSEMN